MEKLEGGYSLIVIDDEAGVVRALELLLKAIGCEVHAFSDPEAAVEFINAEGAQLQNDSPLGKPVILSDLKMPKLDGFGVLQSLSPAAKELPFILMSAHASEEEVERGLELGAWSFLAKPFTPEKLKDALLALPSKSAE